MRVTWASGARRASSSAALAPARPAPTTTTDKRSATRRRIDPNVGAGQGSGFGCGEPGDDARDLLGRQGLLVDAGHSAHVGVNTGGAAHVDDRAAGPPKAEGGLRAQERTSQIDSYHFIPRLDLHVDNVGELEDRGIVHEHIEPPELAEKSVDRCFVARIVTRRATEVAAVVTASRHLSHHRRSDAAGSAGDDRDQPATTARAAS